MCHREEKKCWQIIATSGVFLRQKGVIGGIFVILTKEIKK